MKKENPTPGGAGVSKVGDASARGESAKIVAENLEKKRALSTWVPCRSGTLESAEEVASKQQQKRNQQRLGAEGDIYFADDATCKDGKYDITLDKAFSHEGERERLRQSLLEASDHSLAEAA